MIKDHVQKRIERDYAYQAERIKNLLHIIYDNPDQAWQNWQAVFEANGFDALMTRLQTKPHP